MGHCDTRSGWKVWDPNGPKRDEFYSDYVDTWWSTGGRDYHRDVSWTIDCQRKWVSTNRYKYTFRLTYKMSASSTGERKKAGSRYYAPYGRAWVYARPVNPGIVGKTSDWNPRKSIAGKDDITERYGFGVGVSAGGSLGKAPASVTSNADASYQFEVRRSSWWWHPILGKEMGGGGVQWCNYGRAFSGTVEMAARVNQQSMGDRFGPDAAPLWHFESGQQPDNADCPRA